MASSYGNTITQSFPASSGYAMPSMPKLSGYNQQAFNMFGGYQPQGYANNAMYSHPTLDTATYGYNVPPVQNALPFISKSSLSQSGSDGSFIMNSMANRY